MLTDEFGSAPPKLAATKWAFLSFIFTLGLIIIYHSHNSNNNNTVP
jgi:hypothetical protein